MIPDEIRAELERALPCPDPVWKDCQSYIHQARRAVTPILERLVAERDAALAKVVEAYDDVGRDERVAELEAKLAKENERHGEQAARLANANNLILDLQAKLAAAEALLARRPHLKSVFGAVAVFATVDRCDAGPEECARLGGACAK